MSKLKPPRMHEVVRKRKSVNKARQRRIAKENRQAARLKYLDGKGWIKSRNRYWLVNVLEKPCCQCGEKDKRRLQVDHIRPRALGGSDDFDNLQVLCTRCHQRKTKKDLKKIRRAKRNGVKLYTNEAARFA